MGEVEIGQQGEATLGFPQSAAGDQFGKQAREPTGGLVPAGRRPGSPALFDPRQQCRRIALARDWVDWLVARQHHQRDGSGIARGESRGGIGFNQHLAVFLSGPGQSQVVREPRSAAILLASVDQNAGHFAWGRREVPLVVERDRIVLECQLRRPRGLCAGVDPEDPALTGRNGDGGLARQTRAGRQVRVGWHIARLPCEPPLTLGAFGRVRDANPPAGGVVPGGVRQQLYLGVSARGLRRGAEHNRHSLGPRGAVQGFQSAPLGKIADQHNHPRRLRGLAIGTGDQSIGDTHQGQPQVGPLPARLQPGECRGHCGALLLWGQFRIDLDHGFEGVPKCVEPDPILRAKLIQLAATGCEHVVPQTGALQAGAGVEQQGHPAGGQVRERQGGGFPQEGACKRQRQQCQRSQPEGQQQPVLKPTAAGELRRDRVQKHQRAEVEPAPRGATHQVQQHGQRQRGQPGQKQGHQQAHANPPLGEEFLPPPARRPPRPAPRERDCSRATRASCRGVAVVSTARSIPSSPQICWIW